MIHCIIIEDEPLAAKKLQKSLAELTEQVEVMAVLPSVKKSVHYLRTKEAPDLIFMDIHLEDGLSFSIFEQLSVDLPIIFTTAYDEYSIKAFKVNSIDYLLKPIRSTELAQSIQKFKQLRHTAMQPKQIEALLAHYALEPKTTYKRRFAVHVGQQLLMIETEQVAYFFAEGKYCYLITQDGHKYHIDYTLERLSACLEPHQFFRINRQFIISSHAIAHMERYSSNKLRIFLRPDPDPESSVFVSKERYQDFKQWLDS